MLESPSMVAFFRNRSNKGLKRMDPMATCQLQHPLLFFCQLWKMSRQTVFEKKTPDRDPCEAAIPPVLRLTLKPFPDCVYGMCEWLQMTSGQMSRGGRGAMASTHPAGTELLPILNLKKHY